MPIPKHMQIALSLIGMKEFPGKASNPVVEQFSIDAGFGRMKDDVPWCGFFVASILKRAGLPNELEPKWRGWAASYGRLGTKLMNPVYGCVGVKTRQGGGHVGFVVAANSSTIWLLGGNQGDKVSIAAFPRKLFTAFRLPTGVDAKTLPKLPVSGTGAKSPSEQ